MDVFDTGSERRSAALAWVTARRSIRKYTAEPVSPADIHCLLQAAMAAPSASNRKPWEFVVVSNAEIISRLRRRLVFARYDAPLAIVVCGNTRRAYPGPPRDFWVQDCSAAVQNILLAATALGLGTVWIGVHPIGLFKRAVAGVLRLPKHVIPLGMVYVGHPAESKPARTQYDERRVHWQRYGPGANDDEIDDGES